MFAAATFKTTTAKSCEVMLSQIFYLIPFKAKERGKRIDNFNP